MRFQSIATAIACLTLLSQVHASEENPRTTEEVERVFDAIDRDGDERISKREGERSELVRDRFESVDSDQDGYLSRAEYRARPTNEAFE